MWNPSISTDTPAARIKLIQDDFGILPDGPTQLLYESSYLGIGGRPILTVYGIDRGDWFRFHYDDGTQFAIDAEGSQILGVWPSPLTLNDTAPFVTGPMLGFLLRRRGITCLHASVVELAPGQAVAFVGPAGAGKSTLAAAFAEQGTPVVSDDIAALEDGGTHFSVLPAHPGIRLWSPSVEALYGTPDALPLIAPDDPSWPKRYLTLDAPHHRFQQSPVPLALIYLIGAREAGRTETLFDESTGTEALLYLMRNVYMRNPPDKQMMAHDFDRLSRVADHVPVRWLGPPESLTQLDSLLASIRSDFDAFAIHRPA